MITIGSRATYTGTVHPYLRGGQRVQVTAVHKSYFVDPDRAVVCRNPAELARAGGIDPTRDMVEVRALAADGHLYLGSSDVRLAELEELAGPSSQC